jgi:hypothetical protein
MAQDDDEIDAFRDFLEHSNLAVVPGSIEKRNPPEPDILCRLTDNCQLAFELVEICHPGNAAFVGSAGTVSRLLEETYRNLSRELRNRFDSRFAGKPLSFTFCSGATINRIRVVLPRAFAELVTKSENDEEYRPSSTAVARTLRSVKFVGRVEERDRPSFNVAGVFQPDDVVVESVLSKLGKTYKTPHPIELLAYFGAFAWSLSTSWEHPLRHMLKARNFGPFRRVWVLGWSGIRFVYPP